MTDANTAAVGETHDAFARPRRFAYAARAPMQTIPLRIAKGEGDSAETRLVTVDCVPGRPVTLPDDHKVTRALLAAGFIVPEAADETTDGEGSSPDPVPLAEQPEGSPDRLRAIATKFDQVPDASRTSSGSPRVAAMSPLVGFQVTAAEIEAAQELHEGDAR